MSNSDWRVPLPPPLPRHPAQHPVFVAINMVILIEVVVAGAWSWFAVFKPLFLMALTAGQD